jgi:pSer/pThr/pTyr-binding forkhead associated (FHA) protein
MADVLDRSRPHEDTAAMASLVPLTPEAKRSIGLRSAVSIRQFPFKVGRETHSPGQAGQPPDAELRRSAVPPTNDFHLLEPTWSEKFVSREHFLIESVGDRFFLVDRGSACGTFVGETLVGGKRAGGRIEIRDGSVIRIGTPPSNYRFEFLVHRRKRP